MSARRRRRRGRDSESCLVISHIYKDASSLAQAKGLPNLIYHEPVLEVRFVRGAAGKMRILTIRDCSCTLVTDPRAFRSKALGRETVQRFSFCAGPKQFFSLESF